MLEKRYKKKFSEIFKSITCDNGGEFINAKMLERSIYNGKRTNVYYAHPYASWERGSNENANTQMEKENCSKCDNVLEVFDTKIHFNNNQRWLRVIFMCSCGQFEYIDLPVSIQYKQD